MYFDDYAMNSSSATAQTNTQTENGSTVYSYEL